MTIGISEALALERIAAISATIILFGLLSIGTLWGIRRNWHANRSSESSSSAVDIAQNRDLLDDSVLQAFKELEEAAQRADTISREARQLSNTARDLPESLRRYMALLAEIRVKP